jgi:hypothetical protein
MEQLNQRLKASKVELDALRRSLNDSEAIRNSLVEELSVTRQAKEKLPLFEAKVHELTQENREKELELMGLREDIAEVRQLYRAQLNVLLEEKATASMTASKENGHSGANELSPNNALQSDESAPPLDDDKSS